MASSSRLACSDVSCSLRLPNFQRLWMASSCVSWSILACRYRNSGPSRRLGHQLRSQCAQFVRAQGIEVGG